MTVGIAFLIPSKDRPQTLRRTLAALAGQGRPILVCDQSATPFADPGPWTVLHRPGLTGLPAARNALLKTCDADWAVFLDDDVELPPGFTTTLCGILADHPDLDAVGPVAERRTRAQRRLHRACCLGAFRDPRRLVGERPSRRPAPATPTSTAKNDRSDPRPPTETDIPSPTPVMHPTRALFGCCFAVRGAAARRIGGFDERLPGYALGEDLDFFLRLHRSGAAIRLAEGLGCVHFHIGGHPAAAAVWDFLRRQAGRHGRGNPATPLHLALAAAAMLGRAWWPANRRPPLSPA